MEEKDFWDKRATILRYHEELYHKNVEPESKNKLVSNEDLYIEALNSTGKFSFSELLEKHEIGNFYHLLTNDQIAISIGIGIFGTVMAAVTDHLSFDNPQVRGKEAKNKIEEFFLKGDEKLMRLFNKDYDKVINPADFRSGYRHRYFFGHDPVNMWQKLPEGFLYKGENVGGRTLFDLCADSYGYNIPGFKGQILKPIKAISTLFSHYLTDLPTHDGIPIPGSSLFTKWEENILRASGFSSKNQLMDTLGTELGSIRLSDFSSTAVVFVMLKFYHKSIVKQHSLDKSADKILKNQLATIAYGSNVISQLSLFVYGVNLPAAKLNHIAAMALLKNCLGLYQNLSKENKKIIHGYNESIETLSSNANFESWVKAL